MTTSNNQRQRSLRERTGIATAALVASCASLAAVVSLFDSAGSTPWFAADHASLVAHCEPVRAARQRHGCLQAVAKQQAITRVAAR